MSKLYKKPHLNQHYNRRIPCIRAPTQVRSSEDIYANFLPHGITSGNMIVSKILPAERTEDVKHKAEPMPEPAAETISEQNVEIAKPKLTPPNVIGNIAKPSLYNRTVKVKPCFQNVSVKLEKINEYD